MCAPPAICSTLSPNSKIKTSTERSQPMSAHYDPDDPEVKEALADSIDLCHHVTCGKDTIAADADLCQKVKAADLIIAYDTECQRQHIVFGMDVLIESQKMKVSPIFEHRCSFRFT